MKLTLRIIGLLFFTFIAFSFQIKENQSKLNQSSNQTFFNMEIAFSPRSLPKNLVVTITPSINSLNFKSIAFQGENVSGNARVVKYASGLKYSYGDKIPGSYNPTLSDIKILIIVSKNKKTIDSQSIKVSPSFKKVIYFNKGKAPIVEFSNIKIEN